MKLKRNDLLIAIVLISIAIGFRTLFKIGPNIEFVTIASLGAGYFLNNKKLAMLTPVLIMGITDAIIGNTSIFMFTWSAFMMTPLLGILAKKFINNDKSSEITKWFTPAVIGFGGSIFSVILFYLWTNLGVVITTSMYPDTISGLINSYINALPFLKNQLYGNMIFAPIVFTLVALAKNILQNPKTKLQINPYT